MLIHRNNIIILLLIFTVFVGLHVPALNHSYHQDEYKWPIIVNPAITEPGGIPHPPVGEFLYRQVGFLVGYDNFRLVPFFFGILNFFLLFYLVKNIFDTKTALWSAGLFAVSFFSLLASLMVDTDGAILPFFFLIMAIAYFELRKREFKILNFKFKNITWLILFVLAIVGGFLVKASFAIAIGALALDCAIEREVFADRKKFFKYFISNLLGILVLLGLLFLSKLVFPFFNLQSSIQYWKHFLNFGNRIWLQTFIQFTKAVMYISPLLILPAFLANREIFKKTRVFSLFIALGLLFYLVLFDFSGGALDRYLQFLIVPLCVIGGAVLSRLQVTDFRLKKVIIPILISLPIFLLQFSNHFVPPLYPKAEWLERALSLKWNFLFPFMGGSGPLPFYVSFAFIGLIWIISIIFLQKRLLFGVFVLGLIYNGVFIEEYLFGNINGSTQKLVYDSASFIENAKDIKRVMVYNDNGGWEIRKTGKYARRLYATPQFESSYKEIFNDFSGHVLFINIPMIEHGSFYQQYFASCKIIYNNQDKYLKAEILNCRQ